MWARTARWWGPTAWSLFGRRLGDRRLPPLVVIHGGPTWDHGYLMPPVGELTDVVHVVLFDLPGCGRSQRVRPWGDLDEEQLQPDRLAEVVAALLGGLGGPVDVLGLSYGGRLAMRVVDRHPEAVRRAGGDPGVPGAGFRGRAVMSAISGVAGAGRRASVGAWLLRRTAACR